MAGVTGAGYRRTARLVIVPGKEVRAQHFTEKHEEFATIHTGKFQVVADVDSEGMIHVDRETFDRMFVIEEPEPAEATIDENASGAIGPVEVLDGAPA